MSANLYWEPIRRKKTAMSIGAPSSFMEAMSKAFGSKTPILNEDDIKTLRGMAAVANEDWSREFTALADAVEEHGSVEVSAQY